MGAPDTGTNADDMVTLFDYGFSQFNGVDLSRGPDMFTDPAQMTPETTEAPETPAPAAGETSAETTQEEEETGAGLTDIPTLTPAEKTEVPKNITTTDQKLENAKTTANTEKKSSPVRTFVYIILICVLAVIILLLVVVQVNVTRKRKQNRRKRKR